VPQEDFFLKQSNRDDFLPPQCEVVQPFTGPQEVEVEQLLPQEDFLHLKQSNRPFFGAVPQPLGPQFVGPQFGPQVVEHEDFLPLRQSNKPHFLGWVAQATLLQEVEVAHAFPLCENRPAIAALVNPSEATVARLMQRIHFISMSPSLGTVPRTV
jgi:hypothetical protein